jgi:hypothetical protein
MVVKSGKIHINVHTILARLSISFLLHTFYTPSFSLLFGLYILGSWFTLLCSRPYPSSFPYSHVLHYQTLSAHAPENSQ